RRRLRCRHAATHRALTLRPRGRTRDAPATRREQRRPGCGRGVLLSTVVPAGDSPAYLALRLGGESLLDPAPSAGRRRSLRLPPREAVVTGASQSCAHLVPRLAADHGDAQIRAGI